MLVKDSAAFMDDITRTEVADFLYSTIVERIADELREQEGMQNNNALVDLGDQVANGESVYWDSYEQTVEDMAAKHLDSIPEKFLWAMWQDGRYIEWMMRMISIISRSILIWLWKSLTDYV